MKILLLAMVLLIGCSIVEPEPEIKDLTLEYIIEIDAGGFYGFSIKSNYNHTHNGQTRTLIYVKNLRLTTEDGKAIKYEYQRPSDGIFVYRDCRTDRTYKWKVK
jgi:hypothetical protein